MQAPPSPDRMEIVNYHIASQASHQFRVPGAGRCRHLSAEVFRELDRKRANASSACGDEHLVAGLEVRPLLQRLPRRQPDHRDGGCLHEVLIRRFECGSFFGHDRKLSESARAQPEDAGENSMPGLKRVTSRPTSSTTPAKSLPNVAGK